MIVSPVRMYTGRCHDAFRLCGEGQDPPTVVRESPRTGAGRIVPGQSRPPRRARTGGDQEAAAYWAGREQLFQEILHRANRAALEYLQAWAGITRTGYHGTRIDGREPGRFEPAGLIVTSWLSPLDV